MAREKFIGLWRHKKSKKSGEGAKENSKPMTESQRDAEAKRLGMSPDVYKIYTADIPGGTSNLLIADTGGSPPGHLLTTPDNIGPEYFELPPEERIAESRALRGELDREIEELRDLEEQERRGELPPSKGEPPEGESPDLSWTW